MIQPLFNWKTGLAIIAIAIVSGTIFYSQFLAKKIALEERMKVEEWVEAGKLLVNDPSGMSDKLVSIIITQNKSIPIIVTDEKNNILDHVNLDSNEIAQNPGFLQKKLKSFRAKNDPIEWINPSNTSEKNFYYYGNTTLLNQVRYYPLIQLFIVGLFITITLITLTTSFRSMQNQVWAGMAKETAHQLGTPLSSLQGWVEMLKDAHADEMIVSEMEKDVNRLKLVSDRFGKIGSIPQLEENDVVQLVSKMIDYIKKRAPGKILITLDVPDAAPMIAPISPPLFDWVIENILKNALDAMEGKGVITITMKETAAEIHIDVTDTGKGISKQNIGQVFKPGFTTKKRGWGLGLSLSKRIVEQYHKGQLFVKNSEPGKGTTFRIILKK
ncbi:MAG TPA: HAMP domain-containing sensor histidine kinase [Flavitalea sp.]|nr:HAMP domain-containing sensor histidine kinase [Flavitalea sp.]